MKSNFSTLSPEGRRAMASMGGKAAHAMGTARKWDAEQAREAGRKGGLKVSQNCDHMHDIGSRGGRKYQLNDREIKAKLKATHTEDSVPVGEA
jgi:general stress protein YciG